MNRIAVGQIWSCNDARVYGALGRVRFVIEAIEGAVARVRYLDVRKDIGLKSRGEKSLRSLRRGLCGSRIEREPDGRPGPPPRRRRYEPLGPSRDERSTASDHRKKTPPRGLTREQREQWEKNGELPDT